MQGTHDAIADWVVPQSANRSFLSFNSRIKQDPTDMPDFAPFYLHVHEVSRYLQRYIHRCASRTEARLYFVAPFTTYSLADPAMQEVTGKNFPAALNIFYFCERCIQLMTYLFELSRKNETGHGVLRQPFKRLHGPSNFIRLSIDMRSTDVLKAPFGRTWCKSRLVFVFAANHD